MSHFGLEFGDEDIFVTKNFFNMLQSTYRKVIEEHKYVPGFIAPLIPINGYGHSRILEKLGKIDEYEKLFEPVICAAGPNRMIENNPATAEYMWRLDKIDQLDQRLAQDPLQYNPCPIRFSIGAIYFPRATWERMDYFSVDHSNGMGKDEEEFCALAMKHSLSIIVSENTVVGHLSFGSQNKHMETFYKENLSWFDS